MFALLAIYYYTLLAPPPPSTLTSTRNTMGLTDVCEKCDGTQIELLVVVVLKHTQKN